jgi:hypothetical protein
MSNSRLSRPPVLTISRRAVFIRQYKGSHEHTIHIISERTSSCCGNQGYWWWYDSYHCNPQSDLYSHQSMYIKQLTRPNRGFSALVSLTNIRSPPIACRTEIYQIPRYTVYYRTNVHTIYFRWPLTTEVCCDFLTSENIHHIQTHGQYWSCDDRLTE